MIDLKSYLRITQVQLFSNHNIICSCGHKEKLAKFEERRKKEGGGVNKKEVARYLAQQKKEAEQPLNQAFADALKGIKLK